MNVITSKPLDRRTALRGVGACLALPLLEAMLPRSLRAAPTRFQPPAESPAAHPRMLFCYIPNGVNEAEWQPQQTGADWQLSPTLRSLAPWQRDLTVLSELQHPRSRGGHEGADTWLTGADLRAVPGKDYQNTVSVDQLAAERHGKETRFPSLELSDAGGTGNALHSATLAFDRMGSPLPTENSPQRLFERLFVPAGEGSRAATLQRYADRGSVLDEILGEAKALHRRLGRRDQQKLEEYLNSVRETERRVERLKGWVDVPKPPVDGDRLHLHSRPRNAHDRPMWIEVMLELSYLAFQTDTTRVITFEWAREAGGSHGANGEDHHALSHHGGDPETLRQLAGVDRFHVGKFAYLLKLLKNTREGDGSMLDSTMILFGSGMSNGRGGGHSPKNLPLLLAGGGGLGLRHGKHLKVDPDATPMSNLLLTMLQKMGVETESFSDSRSTLTQLA